jgi:hypothetical protein
MVIEHVFITTDDSTNALAKAAAYLTERGFTAERQDSFSMEQEGWTALEMRRGKKNPARARSIHDLPQVVRVEWHRGRVTVALSISANAVWGGGGFGGAGERPKKMEMHRRLLMAIAQGLEQLLGHDHDGRADYMEWNAVETETRRLARRRAITMWTVLGILLLIVVGLIVIGIVAATH